jgi:asparagine synthetase B (glutamine-hydrolysing)
VISDAYRVYNLYYFHTNDELIISTEMKHIIALINFEYNNTSIQEFLNYGFIIGTKTYFKNVHRFDAATIYTFDETMNLNKELYFSIDVSTSFIAKDYLVEFNNHLAKGIQLSQNVSLPLTAGLDSRTILSGVLNYKDKIKCYTHGNNNNLDVQIAKRICKDLGIEHFQYNLDEFDYNEKFDSLNNIFEASINSILFAHLKSVYEFQSSFAAVLFNGNGGELLRYYYYSEGKNNVDELAEAIYFKIRHSRLLNIDIFIDKSVDDKLISGIREELATYRSDDGYFNSNMFYLYNRFSNFSGFSLKLAGKYLNVFLPFLSKKLLNILNGIKPESIHSDVLQSYIIKYNSTKLTNYLVNDHKISVKWTLPLLGSYISMISNKILDKISKRVSKSEAGNLPFSQHILPETGLLEETLNSPHEVLIEILDFEKLRNIYKNSKLDNSLYYFYTNLITINNYMLNNKR